MATRATAIAVSTLACRASPITVMVMAPRAAPYTIDGKYPASPKFHSKRIFVVDGFATSAAEQSTATPAPTAIVDRAGLRASSKGLASAADNASVSPPKRRSVGVRVE